MFYVGSFVKKNEYCPVNPERFGDECIQNPCGSDYGQFVNLKTISGVENRMKEWGKRREKVVVVIVFSFSNKDKYKPENWRVVRMYHVTSDRGIDLSHPFMEYGGKFRYGLSSYSIGEGDV